MLTAAREGMAGPPEPLGQNLLEEWALDPAVDFLNHGCFGARPAVVCRAQAQWQRRFEQKPIEFLERRRRALLEEARAAVGAFLGMASADFAFVTNATDGINAVLRSLVLEPGDELLTTNHVYNAVRQTLRHVTSRWGADYREIDVPLPLSGPADVIAAIEAALGPRTRLLLIDHVTSPTAVRFPLEQIIRLCEQRGIDVLVDGAHAPGMIDLDVASLGAAWYAGNLHKWVSAPMGTAFLWARPDRQAGIHPTTISHFYGQGFAEEFYWQGSRDITGWLSAPAAIEYFAAHGWPRVMQHNHRLAVWANRMLCERWGVPSATPIDGSMLGSMVTVLLPGSPQDRFGTTEALLRTLYERYRIEVPVITWAARWWLRPCCQIYNRPQQYEKLAGAIVELLA